MVKLTLTLLVLFLLSLPRTNAQVTPATGANVNEGLVTTTLYVAKTGSDQNPGTQALPFKTIKKGITQAFINQNNNIGTKLIIKNGTYREQMGLHTTPTSTDKPVIIEAEQEGGVIISGADVWTGWTAEGNNWTHNWPHNWGAAPLNLPLSGKGVALRREMIVVNGKILKQVLTFNELGPDKFFVNESLNKVFVGSTLDLNTTTVEVPVRGSGLDSLGDETMFYLKGKRHVVLRGLILKHTTSYKETNSAPLKITGCTNILIEKCQFDQNNSKGAQIETSKNMTFKKVVFNENGFLGYSVAQRAENYLFEDCETSYNNWRGFWANYIGYSPAGFKAMHVRTGTWRRHKAVGNQAIGMWIDVDNVNILIENCFVHDNLKIGVHIEGNQGNRNSNADPVANPITLGTILFRNNIVCHTKSVTTGSNVFHSGGVVISHCSDVTLERNICYHNDLAQIGMRDERDFQVRNGDLAFNMVKDASTGNLVEELHLSYMTWDHNVCVGAENQYAARSADKDFDQGLFMNTFKSDNNLFWNPFTTLAMENGEIGRTVDFPETPRTFAQWQAYTGQDSHSIFADPLFKDPENHDFSLLPNSPVDTFGVSSAPLKASQSINFNVLPNQTFGDAPFRLTATASSELPVTFSVVSGPATLSGDILTLTGAGMVTVKASQTGNALFSAALPVNQTFTVAKTNQTITFDPIADKTFSTTPVSLTARASSGLPVAYTVVSGPATLADSSLTLTGAGAVRVRALQEGNADFNAALPLERTFTVTGSPAAINAGGSTFTSSDKTTYAAEGSFVTGGTALVRSGIAIANTEEDELYNSERYGNFTYSLPVTNGSYQLTFKFAELFWNAPAKRKFDVWVEGQEVITDLDIFAQAGINTALNIVKRVEVSDGVLEIEFRTDLNAAQLSGLVVKALASQSIAFNALSNKTFGDAPFTLTASATSGLPVAFSIVSGPATLSGNTLTITGAGTVTVSASQAGDDTFGPASSVQSFTVTKASQVITFAALANKTFKDVPFNLMATTPSQLPVAFSIVSGPATISGNTLSITGAGTVIVKASQAGNFNYNAAPDVTQTFTVDKASQAINFAAISDKTIGDAPFSITATTTSPLPIAYSIVSGPATVSGNTITLTGTGTVTVQASQAGNFNYKAALAVNRTFMVASRTNLALNKSVTVSSQETGNEGPKAVDGNTVNRWSARSWPEWIKVDLGGVFAISKTEIVPFENRAYQYKIEISTDGTTFSPLVDRTTNTTGGALLTDNFTIVNARFVKLTVIGASGYTGGWVSINEFRVFGRSTSTSGISAVPFFESALFTKEALVASTLLYPNPATNKVTLSHYCAVSENVKISIIDMAGTVRFSKVYTVLAGKNDFDLNIENLSSGIYFIKLSAKNGGVEKKLVVFK